MAAALRDPGTASVGWLKSHPKTSSETRLAALMRFSVKVSKLFQLHWNSRLRWAREERRKALILPVGLGFSSTGITGQVGGRGGGSNLSINLV